MTCVPAHVADASLRRASPWKTGCEQASDSCAAENVRRVDWCHEQFELVVDRVFFEKLNVK